MNLLGNRAADDAVLELDAVAARRRDDAHPAVAELSASARLLLVLALPFGARADRFAVGDLRLRELGRHAELSLQLGQRDLEVPLAHAGHERLVRLRRSSASRTTDPRRAGDAGPTAASPRRRDSSGGSRSARAARERRSAAGAPDARAWTACRSCACCAASPRSRCRRRAGAVPRCGRAPARPRGDSASRPRRA